MLGLALSSPMPELDRLILPKAKRRPDAVDGRRDQPARIAALCRFILYPGGLDRGLGPQHQHCVGIGKRLVDLA